MKKVTAQHFWSEPSAHFVAFANIFSSCLHCKLEQHDRMVSICFFRCWRGNYANVKQHSVTALQIDWNLQKYGNDCTGYGIPLPIGLVTDLYESTSYVHCTNNWHYFTILHIVYDQSCWFYFNSLEFTLNCLITDSANFIVLNCIYSYIIMNRS